MGGAPRYSGRRRRPLVHEWPEVVPKRRQTFSPLIARRSGGPIRRGNSGAASVAIRDRHRNPLPVVAPVDSSVLDARKPSNGRSCCGAPGDAHDTSGVRTSLMRDGTERGELSMLPTAAFQAEEGLKSPDFSAAVLVAAEMIRTLHIIVDSPKLRFRRSAAPDVCGPSRWPAVGASALGDGPFTVHQQVRANDWALSR
ncbi:hypothetical protein M2311_006719 [Rhizobium leguminosarum]|nr:hypothetical protein [Rhizobium leguminosarum]